MNKNVPCPVIFPLLNHTLVGWNTKSLKMCVCLVGDQHAKMVLIGWKSKEPGPIFKKACKGVGSVLSIFGLLFSLRLCRDPHMESLCNSRCQHIAIVSGDLNSCFLSGETTLLFEAYLVMFDPPQYNWGWKASHFRTTNQHWRTEHGAGAPAGCHWAPTAIWSLEQHTPHPPLSPGKDSGKCNPMYTFSLVTTIIN